MSEGLKNRLLLLAAALLFSTGGAAIKACAFSSWQVAAFRSGVAALTVLALAPEARKGWNWRILPPAAAYATTLILFVTANKLTTSANTIFLQATAPLYLVVLGPLLLREPIRRADLLFGAVLATGLAMFFAVRQGALATAPDPVRGNILALLSGLTWALTIAGLRWLGKRAGGGGAVATVVAGNLIASLACLPAALPVAASSWADWAVIAYLGMVQIGVAYLCLTRAIGHVPAFEASALLLLEPALNPVWAWLVQGEEPAALALAAGGLILSATLVHTWRESRKTV